MGHGMTRLARRQVSWHAVGIGADQEQRYIIGIDNTRIVIILSCRSGLMRHLGSQRQAGRYPVSQTLPAQDVDSQLA